jgi:6-phosphogluconolactonase
METRMKPKLRIFKDLENLSRAAAEIFVEQAANSISERGRFLVALNGGSTPIRLFQLLASDFRAQVAWSKIHVFWGDERCVPPADPGSSFGQAMETLLKHVAIPDENTHRVKGELDPASASMDYAETLKSFAERDLNFPRFDLVYLGMGEDGHTASLFPGPPVEVTEIVAPVTAHYQDRPANRVTLTPVVFNQARMVVFMVTGKKKASTLAEVWSGGYNPNQYPAQSIRPTNGSLIWLVDEDAAGRLPEELKK